MKISFQINQQYRFNILQRNTTFGGTVQNNPSDTFVRSSGEEKDLQNLLNQETFEHKYGIDAKEREIIKKAVPILAKPHFTEEDFHNLSEKERLILDNLVNKGENVRTYTREDYRISKDAERVLYLSKHMKNHLDEKYPNGYKLVSIGNSAAPFVETMQLLGADTVVMPFSRTFLRGDFPFVKRYREFEHNPTRYTKENWEDYFKHFGITSDFTQKTGKQLIFTDYSASGFTIHMYIKPLLEHLNLKENVEVIDILNILGDATEGKEIDKKLGYFDIGCIIDHASYKKFSPTKSVKEVDFDVFLNPELIDKQEQPFESKLFRYALWKQLKSKF